MIANNTHIKKTISKPKLLTQIKGEMRTGGYSPKTIQAYIKWIKAFIIYNGKHHPSEMGKENVARFLTHLAVNRNVSASTQNQALSTEKYYENRIK